MCLHRLDGEQRRERRVAVVADAPGVEAIVAAHRVVGSEPVGPVAERRLLVEVTVQHGRTVARRGGGDGHDEDRRATVEPLDLHVEIGEGSRERPVRQQFDGAVDVSVLDPVSVESG